MTIAKKDADPSLRIGGLSKNGHLPSWQVQALRTEYGLAPDPRIRLFPKSEIFPGLDRIDASNPKSDLTAAAVIKGGIPVEVEAAVGVVDTWAKEVFETEAGMLLDQDRVAALLKTAVEIRNDNEAAPELKEGFDRILNRDILNRIALESARQRWTPENSQIVLKGYSEYMSLDKLYGEQKASKLKEKIAEEIIYAREYDLVCARESIGKPVIDLPVRGAETAEVVIKFAVREAVDDIGVKDGCDGYYRSRVLGYDRGHGNGGPNRGIPSPEQQLSDLLQREGAPRGAGVELSTGGGTLDADGEMRQGLGTGQVGGLVCEGVGNAIAKRIEAIDGEGIVYDEPKRTNHFREIQVKKTGIRIVTFGDGATSASVPPAMEDAAVMRAPVVFVCEDNGLAIGTESKETHSDVPISQLGRGYGIPGITIDSSEYEKLYAATFLTTTWAALDKGSSLLHVKTERIAPHSPSHGHNRIPPILEAVQEILSEQLDRETSEDRAQKLEEFLDDGIFATSGDTTVAARERIRSFAQSFNPDKDIMEQINGFLHGIIDPLEVVLDEIKREGIIGDRDIASFKETAKKEIEEITERVKKKQGPSKEIVGKHISIDFPQILVRTGKEARGSFNGGNGVALEVPDSDRLLTYSGSGAIAASLKKGREDWGVYVFGIDAYKGEEVFRDPRTRENTIVNRGGYQHENDGVYEEIAWRPGRFRNSRIAESSVLASAMGEFTQPVHLIEPDFWRQVAFLNGDSSYPQTRENTLRRAFINFDYADYGIAGAWDTWFRDGGVYQTSGGNFIRPVHVLMHEGMQGVGGPWHCHSMDAAALVLPQGIDLFTVSTPEVAYNLLNTLKRFGNNPSIILWAREMWNKEQTWREGTGLFQPGQDRVIREGNDLQVITYGQARGRVEEAANKAALSFGGASIGLMEKISWRQDKAGHKDLEDFIKGGTGPIIIASEEPESRSAGHFIASWLRNGNLGRYTEGRKIQVIGSLDVSHPYSAPDLIEAQRPGLECLTDRFLKELQAA